MGFVLRAFQGVSGCLNFFEGPVGGFFYPGRLRASQDVSEVSDRSRRWCLPVSAQFTVARAAVGGGERRFHAGHAAGIPCPLHHSSHAHP